MLEHQVGPAPQNPRAILREQRAPGRQRLLGRAIARRVPATPMRGTLAIVSPVAGFSTGNVSPVGREAGERLVDCRRHGQALTSQAERLRDLTARATDATFCIA